MQKRALAFWLSLVACAAAGQGTVNFRNAIGTNISTNAAGLGGGIGCTAPSQPGTFYYALFTAPYTVTALDPSAQGLLTPTWTFTGLYATNMLVCGRLNGGQNQAAAGWPPCGTNSFVVVGWSASIAGEDWLSVSNQLYSASFDGTVWRGTNWGSLGFFGVSSAGFGMAGDSGFVCGGLPAFDIFGTAPTPNGDPVPGFQLFPTVPLAQAPATNSLVAYYPFDGNASDHSGKGNDGIVQGAILTTNRFGVTNSAYYFDGISSRIQIPDTIFGPGVVGVTISAWITTDSGPYSGDYKILHKSSVNGEITLAINSGLLRFGPKLLHGGGDFTLVTAPVYSNRVTHVVGVYEQGKAIYVYTNGNLANTSAIPLDTLWTNPYSNWPLLSAIGIYDYAPGPSSPFRGVIDDVRVYTQALSNSDVQQLYQQECGCGFPRITKQPPDQTVLIASAVSWSVDATGALPLALQWFWNVTNALAGATNTVLVLDSANVTNVGSYSVVVTNLYGSTTSRVATLTVKYVNIFADSQLVTNSSGTYTGSVTISLQSGYSGGTTLYTLDGSIPTYASKVYSGPFVVTRDSILRVLAYRSDFLESGQTDPFAIHFIPSYRLTAAGSGGGTISVNPPSGPYLSNSIVTATATPATGWSLLQWLGDASGTNVQQIITMTRDKTIYAMFGTTLSTTAAGGGTVSVYPAGGLYPYGATVRLTAQPQVGNYFVLWGSAANGNSNPLYFTITSPTQTISSLFGALNSNQVSLTVSPIGLGQVSVTPRANAYLIGASVNLSATPDDNQQNNCRAIYKDSHSERTCWANRSYRRWFQAVALGRIASRLPVSRLHQPG